MYVLVADAVSKFGIKMEWVALVAKVGMVHRMMKDGFPREAIEKRHGLDGGLIYESLEGAMEAELLPDVRKPKQSPRPHPAEYDLP